MELFRQIYFGILSFLCAGTTTIICGGFILWCFIQVTKEKKLK